MIATFTYLDPIFNFSNEKTKIHYHNIHFIICWKKEKLFFDWVEPMNIKNKTFKPSTFSNNVSTFNSEAVLK